jgi:glycosyltransferase involved in cell wall biosynthesis
MQTYRNIEFIVVDDGSTDNTKYMLQQYGSKIKYIFQNNSGPSAARNVGIRLSSGEIIAFLDADDIWMPNKLELQIQLMQQHDGIGLVGCGTYNIDSLGQIIAGPFIIENYKDSKTLLRDIMLRAVMLGTPNVLIKKECFNKVGLFDESLRGAEDWEMWIRIVKCYDIKFVEEPLVMTRIHGTNTSNNVELMKSCALKVVSSDLYRGKRLLSIKARSNIYTMAGIAYIESDNRYLALANLLKAAISYPLKVNKTDGKYRRLIKCIIPQRMIQFTKRFFG